MIYVPSMYSKVHSITHVPIVDGCYNPYYQLWGASYCWDHQ